MMNIQRVIVKMNKMAKKYNLLKVSKQIHKRQGGLMKKKKKILTTNGTILKLNITHYRKIRLIIKNLILKMRNNLSWHSKVMFILVFVQRPLKKKISHLPKNTCSFSQDCMAISGHSTF